MGIPPWVIGIVIIILITSLSTTVYFIFRKKIGKRRAAVGSQDEEVILEKSAINNPSSPVYPAITPLYNIASSQNSSHLSSKHGLQNNHSSSTIPTTVPSSPYTAPSSRSIDEKKPIKEIRNTTVTSIKGDAVSFEDVDDLSCQPKPSLTESPKTSLPLPPPSSSFFADKMELDSDEANDLYQTYLNVSQNQDFVTVDLDEGSKLSLSNIQQKATSFKSNIYQSLRRKSIHNKSPPIGQFLDTMNVSSSNSSTSISIKSPTKTSIDMSRQSSSTSSRFTRQTLPHHLLPPSPKSDAPTKTESFIRMSSTSRKSPVQQEEEPNSNKIMIDTLTHESYFSLPMSPITPSPIVITSKSSAPASGLNVTDYSNVVEDINQYNADMDESEEEEAENLPRESEEDQENSNSAQNAALAARKLIRSASRKSKTLSMIVTDEDTQAMFTSLTREENMPSAPDISKYATLRGKPNLQKIETLNGSIRVKPESKSSVIDIKGWSSGDNVPANKDAFGSSTVSGKKSIRVQSQLKDIFSDNVELKTTSRKPSPTKETTSLADLFTQPSNDKKDPPSPLDSISTKSEILNKTTTPSSPIETPYSSKNSTLQKAGSNVDTIRKMLQSSWSGNNIKASLSNSSLESSDKSNRSSAYMGSIGSSYRPVASPVGSVNPRLQNQHLISLSLRNTSQLAARARPSIPFTDDEQLEGPQPTVSFSTSTVQTMIPADEPEVYKKPVKRAQQPKKSMVGNLLGGRHQPSKLNNGVKGKTPAQVEREKYLKSLGS